MYPDTEIILTLLTLALIVSAAIIIKLSYELNFAREIETLYERELRKTYLDKELYRAHADHWRRKYAERNNSNTL